MPRQTSPWTDAILDYLEDREWCEYEVLYKGIEQSIPESLAFSKGETYRTYHFKKVGAEIKERNGTNAHQKAVSSGKRLIFARTIYNMRKNGRIAVEYPMNNDNRKRQQPSKIRRIK